MEKLTTSWGTIYLEPPEASAARQILDFATEQKQQGRRTALLPQLPIVYALTGTEAPSRWYELLPGQVSPVQEKNYIADLRRADPEYIILTNLDTKAFGVPYFGFGYDQTIYRWIQDNYYETGQFGRFAHDGSPLLAALVYQRRVLPAGGAPKSCGIPDNTMTDRMEPDDARGHSAARGDEFRPMMSSAWRALARPGRKRCRPPSARNRDLRSLCPVTTKLRSSGKPLAGSQVSCGISLWQRNPPGEFHLLR